MPIRSHTERRATGAFYDVVTPNRTGRGCARAAIRFQRSIESAIAAIRRLKPPAGVAQLHARVVSNGLISVRTIRKATKAAAAGTLACGQEMNNRIYRLPSTNRAEKAIEAIERHGYFVLGA